MAKYHARPSLQYRYEHYDPRMSLSCRLSGLADDDCSDQKDSPDELDNQPDGPAASPSG